MRLYVDVSKRRLRDGLNGSWILSPRFYPGDLVNLEIVLASGEKIISSQLLQPESELRVSLSETPRRPPFATAEGFALDGEVASLVLDLSKPELQEHFSGDFRKHLKVELVSRERGTRETLFAGPAVILAPTAISEPS